MAFDHPGQRSAANIAILGHAAAAHVLPGILVPVLADGIGWLAERPWNRPLREATLEVDGLPMLGVALGARGSEGSTVSPLAALAATSTARANLSDLTRSPTVAAAHVLGAPGRPDLSAMLPKARVALADLRLLPADDAIGIPAWRNAMRLGSGDGLAARAALALRALDALCERIIPARLGRLEVEDVVRVLKGVERSMQERAAVKSIYGLVEGESLLTGEAATLERVRALAASGLLGRAAVILIASHGHLDPGDPTHNTLVLGSEGPTDAGLLTAAELAGYVLSADLVVLSACDSGAGTFQSGQGLFGLPFALTAAGCRSVIQTR